MFIDIKNCNNIDNAKIEIKENRLNIKYAINGIGKSTISSAIFATVNDRINKTSAFSTKVVEENIC